MDIMRLIESEDGDGLNAVRGIRNGLAVTLLVAVVVVAFLGVFC